MNQFIYFLYLKRLEKSDSFGNEENSVDKWEENEQVEGIGSNNVRGELDNREHKVYYSRVVYINGVSKKIESI